MKILIVGLLLCALNLGALGWTKPNFPTDEITIDKNVEFSIVGYIFAILYDMQFKVPNVGDTFKFVDYFVDVEPDTTPMVGDFGKFALADGSFAGGVIQEVDTKNNTVIVKLPKGMEGDELISVVTVFDNAAIVWLARPKEHRTDKKGTGV